MRVSDFEWDEGNMLHLELIHGISPDEAEQVFAMNPIFRKTKRGHYAAFGATMDNRYLVIIFECKSNGLIRPITGWDMNKSEKRFYKKNCRSY